MKEYKLIAYEYGELSPEAKEKVHAWFLDDPIRNDIFSDMLKSDVEEVARPLHFNIQYSLGYCQGDGLNVYGKFDVAPFRDGATRAPALPWPTGYTEKEWRTLQHYSDVCGAFELPYNQSYCYCMAKYISFAEEWIYSLESAAYKNINSELIQRFETDIKNWHIVYCRQWEKAGYEFFYNADPDEVAETCAANEWYFTADGEFLPGV